MTLRRGNLDDMSMSLYSLKQTDNIRSDPQLLIILGCCTPHSPYKKSKS